MAKLIGAPVAGVRYLDPLADAFLELMERTVGGSGHTTTSPYRVGSAIAPDGSVAVEIYARQGKLKGAQRNKPAVDALKFCALRDLTDRMTADARYIIAFADEEAMEHYLGMCSAEYARHCGCEAMFVNIRDDGRAAIGAAQERQGENMGSR